MRIIQTVPTLPSRHGSLSLGINIMWDFGRPVYLMGGYGKLHGTLYIDFLVWSLAIEIRGGA